MALMNVLRFSRLACDTGRKLGSQNIPRIAVKPLLKRFITIKPPVLKEDKISVTFVKANGEKIETKGNVGDSLLDVVVNNDIDLDGYGACEGTLTCSTCHLILEPADFNKLPEKASDEELDMLDLAFDLTDTSRLGCQIILSKDLDGLVVKVPASINDARSSELK